MAQPFHFRPVRPYAPHASSSRRSPAPGPGAGPSSGGGGGSTGGPEGGRANGGYAAGQGQQGDGMGYPMNGYGGGYYAYAGGYQGYDQPNGAGGAGPSSGMEGIVYPAVSPGPGGFDYGASPGSAPPNNGAGPSRYGYNPYYQPYYPPQYGAPQPPYYSQNPYPVYQPAVPYAQNQYQHPQHLAQQPYGYAYQGYMPSHGPGPGGGAGGYPQGGYPPYMGQQVYPNGMGQGGAGYPPAPNAGEAGGPMTGPVEGVAAPPSEQGGGMANGPNGTSESAAPVPEPTVPASEAEAPQKSLSTGPRPMSFGDIEVDASSSTAASSAVNGVKIGASSAGADEPVKKAEVQAAATAETEPQGDAEEIKPAESTASSTVALPAEESRQERTDEQPSQQEPTVVSEEAAEPASVPEPSPTEPAADAQSFGEVVSADSQYMLASSRPDTDGPSITIRLRRSLPQSVRSSREVYAQPRGEPSASTTERKRSKGKERQQHDRIGFPKRLSRERRQAKAGNNLVFGEGAKLEPLAVEASPETRIPEGTQDAVSQAPATTATEAAPATAALASSPAPPVRPVIKSWAALVRASAPSSPAQSGAATPGQSTASPSGITSPSSPPSGSIPLPSVGQASVAGTSGSATPAPARPGGYAAAAWGGAMRHQEDLGKLLLEGLDPRITTRTGRVGNTPRGIINTGNMCFANSILQVLAYCTPFTALFDELSKRVQADLGRKTPLVEAMFMFLREFTASDANGLQPSALPHPNASSNGNARAGPSGTGGKREPFVPTYVYDAMRENKRFDSMRRGHQEDAEEFLGFFLETLHEELLYLHSRHISRTTRPPPVNPNAGLPNGHTEGGEDEREVNRPVSPSAKGDDGWLEVGKKQKINVVRNTESKESAVSRIFGGKLRSVLHTPGQKDSITLEPYQPLQLDISPASVHTITDALLHLHEPETIPGVYSSTRGVNVDATKQVFVETLPPILILHFKRFLYDAVEQKVVKKGKAVGYGTEMAVPSEIMSPGRKGSAPMTYRLFGVIYHHGSSASGGHYTAAVLHHNPPSSNDPAHPTTGTTSWVHLDDETIEEVATDEVVVSKDQAMQGWNGEVGRAGRERCAYLLFYQRV